MRRWYKIATTVWTSLLLAPLVALAVVYLREACDDYDDRCLTGGPLPYAGFVLVGLIIAVGIQIAFLIVTWRTKGGSSTPLRSA